MFWFLFPRVQMSTIHPGLSLRNHSRGYNEDGRKRQNPHTSCGVLQSGCCLKYNLLYSFKVITLYLQCFLFQTDFLWLFLNTFWGIIDLFDFWGGTTLYCHSHRKLRWTSVNIVMSLSQLAHLAPGSLAHPTHLHSI